MKYEKDKIQTATIVKIIVGTLSLVFGILSLFFLQALHIHYTVYISVLLCCIAVSLVLFLSSGIIVVLRHKNVEQEKISDMIRWIYVIAGSIAFMVASPLVIVLLSSQDISFTIYLPCFFIVLVLPISLFIVGVAKCINICRGYVN